MDRTNALILNPMTSVTHGSLPRPMRGMVPRGFSMGVHWHILTNGAPLLGVNRMLIAASAKRIVTRLIPAAESETPIRYYRWLSTHSGQHVRGRFAVARAGRV
jgi:hypothetical protein